MIKCIWGTLGKCTDFFTAGLFRCFKMLQCSLKHKERGRVFTAIQTYVIAIFNLEAPHGIRALGTHAWETIFESKESGL